MCAASGRILCVFGGVILCCLWDSLVLVWRSKFVLCVGQFVVG